MKRQHIAAIVLATFSTVWLATAQDDTKPPATADAPATAPATTAEQAKPDQTVPFTPADNEPVPTNGLVLNFHDVPLNSVLTYLSKAAGLIIVSDVSLQGRVSVVAERPISTNDVVDLLNDQLGKNNYSAILHNRTLTIMDSDRAKTYALTPVKVARGGFDSIPIDDQIVTEILPLKTLQAAQLLKDLNELIPRSAIVTANEAGNSIVMTGQQKDIHRVDEIINSLDGSAVSEVSVFSLQYADSKSVADELKEIFQTEDSNIQRANTRNNFRGGGGGGGRGGGGGGGFNPMAAMMGMGGGGGGGGGGEDPSKNVSNHAVFVADDAMNAVIASAPPDYMLQISNVVLMLDKPSQEITLLRVFHLNHADPGEISDEITAMFTTSTTDQSGRTAGMRFGGFPFGGFGGGGGQAANTQSARMKRELAVVVIPDRRTQSVIVSASKDMMEQIQGVVESLDKGSEGVQKVTALDFGGADPETVQQTLAGLFMNSTTSRNQASSTQNNTPLASRYTGNANAQSTAAQNAATAATTMGNTPK